MSELGQEIIAETRKVAADNPLFIYEHVDGGCQYIRDGAPSCIIGHALWNVGLINADCPWDNFADSSIIAMIKQHEWGDALDNKEISWLSVVQDSQDSGLSWGSSINRADYSVENV